MDEWRKPTDWLKHPDFAGYIILDPDGWRGKNDPPFTQPIPYSEFVNRLQRSTVIVQNKPATKPTKL